MPQQATTATASRWTRTVPTLGLLIAAAAATVGLAAPASAAADSATYLQNLQPVYAYMSESQLLSAGQQACATAHSGVPASDNTMKVSKDMGISTSAAYNIVINAIIHLDC